LSLYCSKVASPILPYALLTAADGSGGDTYSNPAKEVYRRLEVAGVGAHTLAKVKSMLNTLEQKLDR
jgi:hypothetical protein